MHTQKPGRSMRRLQNTVCKSSIQAKTSNIRAKRVSLYPGFLKNGVVASTTRKPRGKYISYESSNSPRKPEDPLLTENLQVFLDRKSIHSQRITDKNPNVEENNLHLIKSIGSVPSLRNSALPISPKPIIKKNSKSIFKKISNKIFEIPVKPETYNNSEDNIAQTYPAEDYDNNKIAEEEDYDNNKIELDSSPKLVQPIFPNKFLETFDRKMKVIFKSDFLKKSNENIAAEILKQNSIVEGKIPRAAMSKEDKTEEQFPDCEDKIQKNVVPVPPKKWVYNTPKNQKIKRRKVKQSQLQPAILFNNKTVKTIKTISNPGGAYHNGFVSKMPEQLPSNKNFFTELPFAQSAIGQRIRPMETNTFLESPALSEDDITFETGYNQYNLRSQVSQPNKIYTRQTSYNGEKHMFDFHSKTERVFNFC